MTDKMLNWLTLGIIVVAEATLIGIYHHFAKKVSKL